MTDDRPRSDPESLALRARPRRVVRFKRRMVIGIAAISCTAVFGAAWLALNGTTFRHRLGDQELYSTDRKTTPVAAADGDRLHLDPDRDQNYQQRKLDFLNRKTEQGIYNPHGLQDPASPYEVLAGTVIPASLLTGVNSDLPGFVTAQVTENIYDSVTGRT